MEYVNSPKVYTLTELKEKRLKDKCNDYTFKFNRKSNQDQIWKFDSTYINHTSQIPSKKPRVLSPQPIPKSYAPKKVK